MCLDETSYTSGLIMRIRKLFMIFVLSDTGLTGNLTVSDAVVEDGGSRYYRLKSCREYLNPYVTI